MNIDEKELEKRNWISSQNIDELIQIAKKWNKGKPINQRFKYVIKCQYHTANAWIMFKYLRAQNVCICIDSVLSLRQAENP